MLAFCRGLKALGVRKGTLRQHGCRRVYYLDIEVGDARAALLPAADGR